MRPVVFIAGQVVGQREVLSGPLHDAGQTKWRMQCCCGRIDLVNHEALRKGRADRCRDCAKSQSGAAAPAWKGCGEVSSTAYITARFSAVKRDLEWAVTIEDLAAVWAKQGGTCALSGRPMTMKRGNRYPSNSSLDRKNSSLGYTPDNIQFVRVEINMAKQKLSDDEFVEMCRDVVRCADR